MSDTILCRPDILTAILSKCEVHSLTIGDFPIKVVTHPSLPRDAFYAVTESKARKWLAYLDSASEKRDGGGSMKKPNHIEWGIAGTTKDPNYIPPPADKYPGVDFEMDSRLLTLEQIKALDVDRYTAADMLMAEIHCKNREAVVAYLRKVANA